MTRKKSLPPKHKRLNQKRRLQAAAHWIKTYQGENIAKGYRKHFGTDWLTTFKELKMLGQCSKPDYEHAVLLSVQGNLKAREKRKLEKEADIIEKGEVFAYIDGYTSDSSPHGTIWEDAHPYAAINLRAKNRCANFVTK